ncbi:MAG TPA: hypothetical protein VGN26_19190 [Armatimonadota bacterium]
MHSKDDQAAESRQRPWRMARETVKMPDGRDLHYYSFQPKSEAAKAAGAKPEGTSNV